VAVLSVLLLGLLNYFQARHLLTESVSDQLVNQQAAKALAIRNGVERLEQAVVVTAQTSQIIDAVSAFSATYDGLAGPDLLDAEQETELDAFYVTILEAIAELGLESIAPEDLQPGSEAGRYLQYHYIVANDSDPRSDLVAAPGDDSDYGAVHTERHPDLVELRTQLAFGDLLLVDTEGNIVYSVDKRLDFATNAATGPYKNSGMGEAVTSRLAAAPVGEAVFVDFELYLPAAGKPSLFVASAIRDEARTIGALLVEIPIDGLNNLTIGNGEWEENGLGETGEVYVVGRDRLMRTDSRLWIEDPQQYLTRLEKERFDPSLGPLIETFGSTVLLQPVDTKAVVEALDGERFLGRTSNYLGQSSLTASGPVGAEQVDWVVVAEVSAGEASDPLRDYVIRIIIAGLVLIPIVIFLAFLFADRMTRPVRPVVAAAAAVAQGNLDTKLPDLGRNEFGDVGRRLNLLTAALREKEEALAAEEKEITRLLLSALPTRVVQALRDGEQEVLDLVDTATVVAFDVDGIVDGAGLDEEAGVQLSTEFSQRIEAIADQLNIERVRSSTDQHVFASGLDTPDSAVDVAADFALQVVEAMADLKQKHGLEMTYRAGISAGHVIAGLLHADQLTYGVFGDPPRTAMALAGVAATDQILIDDATAAELHGGEWTLEPAAGLVDLQGNELAALALRGPVAQAGDQDST
jgi:class 3 adenylate cyclase